MADLGINVTGKMRDPNSFNNLEYKFYGDKQVVTIEYNGQQITITGCVLAMIAMQYFDYFYKTRIYMVGLESIWDIVQKSENKIIFKFYQLTQRGFTQRYKKLLKSGEIG